MLSVLLALSIIPALSLVINVNASVVERQNTLDSLAVVETIVYTGNQGSIGMEDPDAAHPSILYLLTDANQNNDNGVLGSINNLVDELLVLQQCMDSLIEEEDDHNLFNIST